MELLGHSDCSEFRKKHFLKKVSHNWDLLVSGPELAMLRMPRPAWDRLGRNSSLKGFPQKDSPPENKERGWGRKERDKETRRGFIWLVLKLQRSLCLSIITQGHFKVRIKSSWIRRSNLFGQKDVRRLGDEQVQQVFKGRPHVPVLQAAVHCVNLSFNSTMWS